MNNKIFRFLVFFMIFLRMFQLFTKNDKKQISPTDDVVITSEEKFIIGKEV